MLIIPAVDIRGGKVVRLQEGDYSRETVYCEDPLAAALRWKNAGAEYLHVVDLDGAREGVPVNFQIAADIAAGAGIPVEVGGGVRSIETAGRYIDAGVDMVILGTGACAPGGFLAEAVAKYGDKIAASLDCRGDSVEVCGWMEKSEKSIVRLLGEFEDAGVSNLIFTDITRDGLLGGVNAGRVGEIVGMTSVRVTVAGGVGSLDDIIKLKDLDIRGVIAGKALYSGNLNFREAKKCLIK